MYKIQQLYFIIFQKKLKFFQEHYSLFPLKVGETEPWI